jgi:hypothetical protein
MLGKCQMGRSIFTCVNSDVLYQASGAFTGVAAVATLELAVEGPLEAVHQQPRAVVQRDFHGPIVMITVWESCYYRERRRQHTDLNRYFTVKFFHPEIDTSKQYPTSLTHKKSLGL